MATVQSSHASGRIFGSCHVPGRTTHVLVRVGRGAQCSVSSVTVRNAEQCPPGGGGHKQLKYAQKGSAGSAFGQFCCCLLSNETAAPRPSGTQQPCRYRVPHVPHESSSPAHWHGSLLLSRIAVALPEARAPFRLVVDFSSGTRSKSLCESPVSTCAG